MVQKFCLFCVFLSLTMLIAACNSVPTVESSIVISPTAALSSTQALPVVTEMVSSPVEPTQTQTGSETEQTTIAVLESNRMNIQVNSTMLTATLVENSSSNALKEILANGPLTINMHDYGNMEKVGPLGVDLPRNDQQITTEAGDIILYQGNKLVFYYAPNSWNFTKIGKIDNITPEELREILGDGNVTITLSLPN